MKFWITGADGLLGKTLSAFCAALQIPHIATSKKEADLRDEASLLQIATTFQPTHIINCAAYTHVDLAEKEPLTAYAVNRDGAGSLAKIAHSCNTKFIHISTNYVFEGTSEFYQETDATHPLGVYGKSKWEGEQLVFKNHPNALVIRTSWVFGPQGNNFISSLWNWLKTNEIVKAASDQKACLTNVTDLAEAILMLRDHCGIYHFANDGLVSRYEVALELLETARSLKIPIKCKKVEPALSSDFKAQAPRPLLSGLRTEKYQTLFGAPRHWKESLKETISYETTSS